MTSQHKINAFLENDDNFEAVAYDDPRAVAIRAAAAKRNRTKAAKRARINDETLAMAAAFSIGQVLKNKNRPYDRDGFVSGPVVAIDGKTVTIDVRGTRRTFVASALVAA